MLKSHDVEYDQARVAMTESTARLLPDLVGTRVLLIGGGGSVGRTTAKLAQELGATPVVADRDDEALERARDGVGDVEAHIVDARDESSVAALLDAAAADHVVLCTGWPLIKPLVDIELAELMDWVGDRFEPIFRSEERRVGKECRL